MEIIASILMVLAVALPILLALAVVGFVALLGYSWIKDARSEREPAVEPVTPTVAPQRAPHAAAPAA
jgi:hypothetical protein